MLLAETVPPEIINPCPVPSLLRPTVTVPKLATAPEFILNAPVPSLPLLPTCVAPLVRMPLTFTLPLILAMLNVPLVITPPLLTLRTSAAVPASVVLPVTSNPAAVIVRVGMLVAAPDNPSVSEAMLDADIAEL